MQLEFFAGDSGFFGDAFFGSAGLDIVVISSNSTVIVLQQPETGVFTTITGFGFTFDSFGDPTGGTIRSMTFSLGQTPLVTMTDVDWSLVAFAAALDASDNGNITPLNNLWNATPLSINGAGSINGLDMNGIEITFTTPVTIVGSAHDDNLIGGSGNDSIDGRDGNDILRGLGGNDTLFGEIGRDKLFGGANNDILWGGAGKDLLKGGNGRDTLYGDADNDRLHGGGGKDLLKGGNGKDILYGDGGRDRLEGGAQSDKLFGGSGNDKLFGNSGRDILNGNSGRDILNGGTGADQLTGGSGADTFVFKDGYGKDAIRDFQNDVDTIHLDDALWSGTLTKQQVINQFATVVGGDIVFDFGTDELTIRGFTDLADLMDDMVII
jgi:Ca2+-binding RTX toxin-like protein